MFTIIQSHRTENLVNHLLEQYQSEQQNIFDPFVVIVPSMVLGDWLDKSIASRAGISTLVMTKFWGQYQWTLMQEVLSRHNQYLLQNDPNAVTLNVPEVAVLSSTVMQWRIFGYLTFYQTAILQDERHPLFPILSSLLDDAKDDKAQKDARLWQLANDLARVFNRYLTHRNQWLTGWNTGQPLDIAAKIKEKDTLSHQFDEYAGTTPDWLIEHYVELESAQRFLWQQLFAGVHQHRANLESVFWHALKENRAGERDVLPKILRIFTIQQLPQAELNFLQRLAQYMDITLLHYNPSKLFWADIVDKSWLQRQKIINPQSVFLREYGHSLLSRLGKQSRDTFAMLAGLSGNEDFADMQVNWDDDFSEPTSSKSAASKSNETEKKRAVSTSQSTSDSSADSENISALPLLKRLQKDVLMLDEQSTQQAAAVKVSQELGEQIGLNFDDDSNNSNHNSDNGNDDENSEVDAPAPWYDDSELEKKRPVNDRQWDFSAQDNSLSIHSCHSLQRQLEVLRMMIGRWLNEPLPKGVKPRHISDIVVLLPDVERHHALINAIFVNGRGQDGLTLPAKITGVVDASIRQLWEAITGFYKLLGSDSARFEATEVLDWLMLPPLYENFGLTHDEMSRGCDLLMEAGFIRGFDEAHLKRSLDAHDYDYRFSFAQALDKLTLGLVMPEASMSDCLYPLDEHARAPEAIAEHSLPMSKISLNDAPIVNALCRIFTGLADLRNDYTQSYKAEEWLERIETQVIHRYFSEVDQTRSMRAIYNAMNGFKSSLRANRHYKQFANQPIKQAVKQNTDATGKTSLTNEATTPQADAEREQKLAGVENLPLKLSFMLESIEGELESQQVSAEPTGVITFGRFGALRNVPFDLVVMLNMNLSEFPARDRDNRYDLMSATISERGDRVSEDDDNGAFLDALLCARDACWIFYNGQSLTDKHQHLPANPVSELLQFLQGDVHWRTQALDLPSSFYSDNTEDSEASSADTPANIEASALRHSLPRLVEQWLVTEHPALPFDDSLFIDNQAKTIKADNQKDKEQEVDEILDASMHQIKIQQRMQYPPAKLWQAVHHQLEQTKSVQMAQLVKPVISLPTRKHYQALASLLQAGDTLLVTRNSSNNSTSDASNTEQPDLNTGSNAIVDNTVDNMSVPSTKEAVMALCESYPAIKACFDIKEIDIDGQLLYQVRHPGKAFLREQQVYIMQGAKEMTRQEPLALDHLQAYQLKDYLINQLVTKTKLSDNLQSPKQIRQGSQDDDILLYQNLLPAGVARQTTLPNHHQKLEQQCDDFTSQLKAADLFVTAIASVQDSDISTSDDTSIDTSIDENIDADDDTDSRTDSLALLTPTKEEPTTIKTRELYALLDKNAVADQNNSILDDLALWQCLPTTIKLKGSVPLPNIVDMSDESANDYPKHSPKQWLNLLPNSASAKHLLKFWLSHLYWQVARRTTAEQVANADGISIWRFNKASKQLKSYEKTTTFRLDPIPYETAAHELIKWAIFGKLSGQVPMTLLPDYALPYIEKMQKAQVENKAYQCQRGDFDNWFKPFYQSTDIYDTCVLHPIWQYILQEQDNFKALTGALTTVATPLYTPMFDALQPVS